MTRSTGLRESKRLALERSLATIALDLTHEHGIGAVTVDDIVERAGVSRRTFFNYYPCKEAAVAAVVVHTAADGLASWRAPVDGDGTISLVRDLLGHQVRSGTLQQMQTVRGLATGHPPLVAFLREAQWRVWEQAGERLNQELGEGYGDRGDVLELVAVMGALFGVVTRLIGSDPPAPPEQLGRALNRVLDRLARGLDT